jgi:tetratricopeptide (TPR) repeat protein
MYPGSAMSRLKLFAAALILLAGLFPAAAAERVALIVGNSNYRFAPRLANPRNDAADMAQLLRGLGFDVIEAVDVGRRALEDALAAFNRKLTGSKLAVFFYAGHGLQVGGRNYLVPVDGRLAKEADLSLEAVDLNTILEQMERDRRANLVFLDACRDNQLAVPMAAPAARPPPVLTRGLAPVGASIGTLIAFATQPGNVALDGDGRNSPFTSALLKRLRTPGLDISGVMKLVRADVFAATGERQVPWDHSSLIGDVVLVPGNSRPAAVAAATPPAPPPAISVAPPVPPAASPPQHASAGAGAPAPPDIGAHIAALAAIQCRHMTEAETAIAECDRVAADPYARDKPINVRGVHRNIISRDAIRICADAVRHNPQHARSMYQFGRALYAAKDYAKALVTYNAAVNLGSVEATTEMGRMAFFGHGLPQNIALALDLFRKAAAQGDPSANKNIGFMYHKGHGVQADVRMALAWYEKAPHHPTVMNNLGVLYEEGAGVPKNPVKARALYEKAVAGGEEAAMNNLAIMYENGITVARDLRKARLLYEMADKLGYEPAREALNRLAR